jgi:hypothetical protein
VFLIRSENMTILQCKGRISDIPWKLLVRPPRITAETLLGNILSGAQRRVNTEPTIGVTRQRDAQGYVRPSLCRKEARLESGVPKKSTA